MSTSESPNDDLEVTKSILALETPTSVNFQRLIATRRGQARLIGPVPPPPEGFDAAITRRSGAETIERVLRSAEGLGEMKVNMRDEAAREWYYGRANAIVLAANGVARRSEPSAPAEKAGSNTRPATNKNVRSVRRQAVIPRRMKISNIDPDDVPLQTPPSSSSNTHVDVWRVWREAEVPREISKVDRDEDVPPQTPPSSTPPSPMLVAAEAAAEAEATSVELGGRFSRVRLGKRRPQSSSPFTGPPNKRS